MFLALWFIIYEHRGTYTSGPSRLSGLKYKLLSRINILFAIVGEAVPSRIFEDVFVRLYECIEEVAFFVLFQSRIHRLEIIVKYVCILRIFHLEHVC